MNKLLIITGPTATGKTALGIELAKRLNGEIISADSRQVFTGNDEESGKDRSFPQWGIDIVEPGEEFSASAFVSFAQKKISDIVARGKLPIIVGGTGQYIKELILPSETLLVPINTNLRKKLDGYSLEHLQHELTQISNEKWQAMNDSDRKNPRRLIRAIEVASQNKKSKIEIKKYDSLLIGLSSSKDILYQRILYRRKSRPDLVEKEFKLAKKQLLYMQKYLPAVWFDISDPDFRDKIFSRVNKWYTRDNGS